MSKNQKYGGIEKHKRVNVTPSWVSPDMLTIFGFLAGILIGVSYLLTNLDKNFLWLANLGFVLNWLGDSLDGNLARYRKIERPRYGFFIDHAVDIITEVFIFLGLAFSPYVDFKIAILALIAYLCMTNLVF
jgi:archaetidylinositol phosphate synthase